MAAMAGWTAWMRGAARRVLKRALPSTRGRGRRALGPRFSPASSAIAPVGLLLCLALLSVGAGPCAREGAGLRIDAPAEGLLSLPGPVALRLLLPPDADPATLQVTVDGQALGAGTLQVAGDVATGTVSGLPEGRHQLVARVSGPEGGSEASSFFVLEQLDRPDQCENLNRAECVLPFPSSRFLVPADTETGFRVSFGAGTLPDYAGKSLDPTPFQKNDGFSPTVQILMNFPGGMDPVLSNAPRIDPTTRTFGTRGLDRDSPTLLIDWDTGKRINHWIENDARATDPSRVVTFLRPAESLIPGHRYIVAVRHLVDAGGNPVPPEPVFENIRDRQPSTIPGVEAERDRLEPVLERLSQLGVRREDLILAFDFVVQSDSSLTHDMLSMRDQSLAWLAQQAEAGVQTFTVNQVEDLNPGCTNPNVPVWRYIQGTFEVPLFLDKDPFTDTPELSFLLRDASGEPTYQTVTHAPYGIAIPCAAFEGGTTLHPLPGLVVGHGLFGEGPGTVKSLASEADTGSFHVVPGGTNWSGLSKPDTQPDILHSFIVHVLFDLNKVDALADRLRQGQTDTLVLARMMRLGLFDADPAFQDAEGHGAFAKGETAYYFGGSLGGIMGTMFAALTNDVKQVNLDVPAINFSLLLQRATPFIPFDQLLSLLNPDAMDQAIGISLIHEIWVRGEPAGYATHVTSNPLPGSIPKHVLMSVALYDQQVSNLGSQLAGRTLRLENFPGSVVKDLPGIPDAKGPLASAYAVYDTGSFDVNNPADQPFIPPLVNRPAQPNHCDPHPIQGHIPAFLDQLRVFFQPDGKVLNFCDDDGICNASDPYEIPYGNATPCDPLSP